MTGAAGWDAVLARHVKHLELSGHEATTVRGRRDALRRMAAVLPGGVLEATTGELLAWRAALSVGDGTVQAYVCHARQFYAWAVAEGLRAGNPATELPVPRKARRLPRPVTEDNLLAALELAPARVRPWLVLAGWAGLRAIEIAFLRRENVVDTGPEPVILVASDATKGRRERVVPMSAFVGAELHAAGLPRSGWVFRRQDGLAGPNRPARISGMASSHLQACGFAVTLHQLRHRFGTQAYAASRDLRMVQEVMGHADPATTAGYVAYDRDGAARAVNALPVPPPVRLAPVRRIG